VIFVFVPARIASPNKSDPLSAQRETRLSRFHAGTFLIRHLKANREATHNIPGLCLSSSAFISLFRWACSM